MVGIGALVGEVAAFSVIVRDITAVGISLWWECRMCSEPCIVLALCHFCHVDSVVRVPVRSSNRCHLRHTKTRTALECLEASGASSGLVTTRGGNSAGSASATCGRKSAGGGSATCGRKSAGGGSATA